MENEFLIHDPEAGDIYFYDTKEEWLKNLREIILSYTDDAEWIADPRQITAAKVTVEIVEKIIAKRSEQIIDKDGYDEEGRWWKDGIEDIIDYEIVELLE